MDNVVLVRNCVLPLDLYYLVESHIWIRPNPDNIVTLGFTDVAQTTAGSMLTVSYRPIGKFYPRNKVVALVESGKWLGALRTPIAGVLAAVNETLPLDAGLMNRSPYDKGWVVQIEPTNLKEDLTALKTGDEALVAYETVMIEKNLDDCIHCEGYEFPEGIT
ncbi:MAG: glycine cleavage system protein H [Chloroflexi bacterium]|nr:glycine cleavage system protein H [Chloroflexota bacterium]